MKVALIAIGSAAGAYTIFAVIQLVSVLGAGGFGSVQKTTSLTASISVVALGMAVTLACFQKALAKKKVATDQRDQSAP